MPQKGIQILHHSSLNVTVGALASVTAIAADGSEYAGASLTAGFLMKKIEGHYIVEGSSPAAEPDDIPLLCLVYGDSDASEVAAALVTEQPNPAVDSLIDQATVRRIVIARGPDQTTHSENDANPASNLLQWDLSKFVLPGKGMPFPEGQGWAWFLFNFTGGAFTDGGVGQLWARYKGVWLSD